MFRLPTKGIHGEKTKLGSLYINQGVGMVPRTRFLDLLLAWLPLLLLLQHLLRMVFDRVVFDRVVFDGAP